MIITLSVTLWVCFRVMKAEAHVRYVGISNLAAEKIAMTVHGMEMNARNVFDEVAKHMDTPDAVVNALECKTELNPEVKGYFAAFEPDYFKQKGRWFEPYVHHKDSSLFVVSQVGSARHDYTQSNWYIRAKEQKETFWSDPYYYQDNDEIGQARINQGRRSTQRHSETEKRDERFDYQWNVSPRVLYTDREYQLGGGPRGSHRGHLDATHHHKRIIVRDDRCRYIHHIYGIKKERN